MPKKKTPPVKRPGASQTPRAGQTPPDTAQAIKTPPAASPATTEGDSELRRRIEAAVAKGVAQAPAMTSDDAPAFLATWPNGSGTTSTAPRPTVTSGKFPPTEEQQVIIDTAKTRAKVVIVVAGAGCLAADTEINLNRGGKGFRMAISRVVRQFNGEPDYITKSYRTKSGTAVAPHQVRNRPWDLSVPTYVARADDGVVRLGRLKAAWFSGDKETFAVTTPTGRTIRATAEHPFMANTGEWKKLSELRVGSWVDVNSGRSAKGRTADVVYPQTATKFHPYQTNNSGSGRIRFKVAKHRAVVEASINGLSLDEFLRLVRTDEAAAGRLTYLPRHRLVHHKDEDPNNYALDNLVVLDGTAAHSEEHEWGRNVLWQVDTEEIVSIKRYGIEPTYDIEVEDDPHNFLANGFVVHNTGKTTTLRFLADNLRGIGQYTAFNTKLVSDSSSKFHGTRVNCNTTHSLAFRAIGHRYKHRLDGPRVRSNQIAAMLDIGDLSIETVKATEKTEGIYKTLNASWLAGQLVKALGRFSQSADREISRQHFKYIDGIDVPQNGKRTYTNNDLVKDYLLPYAQQAWEDIASKDGALPFSHDYYVKLWQLGEPIIAADYILLDEAQDSAPVLLDIVSRQQGQLILVGDSSQQIYDWRGAVDALKAFPDAPRAYLSQSFRFGPAVAKVANRVLSTLQEPTPLRLKGLESINSRIGPIDEPTAVLTRTNAVAVGTLLEALVGGKSAFLVGGGADVRSFVSGAQELQQRRSTNHPELACFNSWLEVQEYAKQDEGEDLKLMVNLIDSFGADTILHALDAMPEEKDADLVVSTAHKSKGREWERVTLAGDFPAARWGDEEEEGEGNGKSRSIDEISDSDKRLVYVAVTRAKLELDITECPFFTGQKNRTDYKSVAQQIRDNPPQRRKSQPTSSGPSPKVPETFSWSKWDNAWVVRGPSGREGQTVDVTKRDGSTSRKKLSRVIREVAEGISLYE